MSFCQGPWSSSDSITNDLCDLGQDPVLLRTPVFPPSEWIRSGDKIFTSAWHWIGADARGVQLPLVFLRWHYPATCSQPEASRAGVKMTWHHSNPVTLYRAMLNVPWVAQAWSIAKGRVGSFLQRGLEGKTA